MHIGVWRSLVARLNGVQEAASSNLVTPTIAEPPILGQEKRKTFKHAFLFFLSPFRGRLFPLLSVTRLFEIVTRSCLDISISRHPLSAIAIPSLLFAPLLSNLVTPTIAEPPILGQEKKEDVQTRLPLARNLLLILNFSQVYLSDISYVYHAELKIIISVFSRRGHFVHERNYFG